MHKLQVIGSNFNFLIFELFNFEPFNPDIGVSHVQRRAEPGRTEGSKKKYAGH
jgi:hypothetical protein